MSYEYTIQMSGPIEQIVETVASNPALTAAASSGVTWLGMTLKASQKELIARCSEWVGIGLNAKKTTSEAKAQGEAKVISARHEVEAEKIRKLGSIEIRAEEQRAISLYISQATKGQKNIDSIFDEALGEIHDDASPQDIDEDWLNNFFDKGRLISDPVMQKLWSKVLAGEANYPGKHSKRLINLLQSMEKQDAENFQSLGRFSIGKHGLIPVIYSVTDDVYAKEGLLFSKMKNLESLGLISYDTGNMGLGNFGLRRKEAENSFDYFDQNISCKLPENANLMFNIGSVMLTKMGQQLSELCVYSAVEGFPEYLTEKWRSFGYEVTLK